MPGIAKLKRVSPLVKARSTHMILPMLIGKAIVFSQPFGCSTMINFGAFDFYFVVHDHLNKNAAASLSSLNK
jgi:hypothetical protein